MKNLLLSIFLLSSIAAFSQVPSNGLVRNYSFSNDFLEASGGDSATPTNITFTTDYNGSADAALDFDGTASIVLGSGSDLNVTSFSLGLWINTPQWAAQTTLVDKKNSYKVQRKNGFIELAISSPSRVAKIPDSYFPVNIWSHLIVTFDSGNVQFFVNGINVSNQIVNSTAPVSNGLPMNLGKGVYTNFGIYTGKLDEFLLYNRAITSAEATQIYDHYTSLCFDGIQNGNETGIDCGGPDCDPCVSCSDGILNGNETDIDCGGPDCDPCSTIDSTAIIVESFWDTLGNTITPKDIALNVGIGTTDALRKLSVIGDVGVEGNVKAIDFTATPNVWADYVFLDEYELPTLEEIEAFIALNKHLPNVPSQKEVLEKGTNLAETDVLLLEKIEELTLHLIQMNKRVKELEAKLAEK